MIPQFNTIYTHYSDEVARRATITIEGDTTPPSLSGGDDYGPAALVDDNPAKVAKINALNGAWIFAYEARQPIRFAALIHTSAAAEPPALVRLEGNDTNVWTAPAFSATFTIPEWLGTGEWRWPQNPYLVLDDLPGFAPGGFFFWRLTFQNQTDFIRVGQVRFHSTFYRFDPDLRWGLNVAAEKPIIESRTAFGVSTIYSRGTTIWREEADIMLTDAMRIALVEHWYDVEGRARPWVIVPSGPAVDDRCYLVRYTLPEESARWIVPVVTEQRLQFQEVGRGLRP